MSRCGYFWICSWNLLRLLDVYIYVLHSVWGVLAIIFLDILSAHFPLSSPMETPIMQMSVCPNLLKPLFFLPSFFFLSAPQRQYLLLPYFNVCWLFFLHAQTSVNFHWSYRIFSWFFMVSISLLAFTFCLCIIFWFPLLYVHEYTSVIFMWEVWRMGLFGDHFYQLILFLSMGYNILCLCTPFDLLWL